MQVRAIGLSFYEREDYPRIREIMVDPHNFAATYGGFVEAFEKAESNAKSQGLVVIRAVIKPDEFVAWCRSRGLQIDSQARQRFAAEVAAREKQGGG